MVVLLLGVVGRVGTNSTNNVVVLLARRGVYVVVLLARHGVYVVVLGPVVVLLAMRGLYLVVLVVVVNCAGRALGRLGRDIPDILGRLGERGRTRS